MRILRLFNTLSKLILVKYSELTSISMIMASSSKVLPTLDCSEIQRGNFQQFSTKLVTSFKEKGMVYLVNHGLTKELIDSAFIKSKTFFELPLETKLKYGKEDPLKNFHGFTPEEDEYLFEHDPESAFDYAECWDVWGPDAYDESKYPVEVPGFKKSFDDISVILVELSKAVLKGFAIGLELDDPNFFLSKHLHFDDPTIRSQEVFRSYYYFPLREGVHKRETRLSEHSDWGTFAFMIPESGRGFGNEFEVHLRDTKEWIQVPPKEDAIILCAGFMMEMWTGGNIHAPRHRVVVGDEKTARQARQSLDLYIQPDGNVTCLPLVEELEEWDPKYPKKVQGQTHFEYFSERVKRTRKRQK